MVIAYHWVFIDPKTQTVVGLYIGERPSLQHSAKRPDWGQYAVEAYDPDIHPPVGYAVRVGADWKARMELGAPTQVSVAAASPDSTSDASAEQDNAGVTEQPAESSQ